MYRRTSIFLAVALAVPVVPVVGCSRNEPDTRRWVSTHNTNVAIDWDKVNEAYRLANGPEDLERRINEIYPGDEVISIAVADRDATSQEVTGFFDRNTNGSIEQGEKIFTIRREITGEGTAQVQTVGHGPYGYYHSPLLTIASGMMLGSMMSRAFSPGYAPMYTRPYVTSGSRLSEIGRSRPGFRSNQPGTFSRPRASGSGRVYGGGRPSFPRGGGRFGVRRDGRPAPIRLSS